jgi:hypothetical protein
LRKEFEAYGLEVNPYDPCVVNMLTKSRKQLTVDWHVDDLMGLCKEDFELTKFSCYLARIYGTKLSMHTGKRHNYLGMNMEFRDVINNQTIPRKDHGESSNLGGGASFCSERQEGDKSAQGRESIGISPHCGATTLHVHKCA